MKKLLLLSFTLILGFRVYAQEVCNDGRDNDGDGFIDCFDNDCANSSDCDGSYIGNDVFCEAVPTEFPKFSMTEDFSSPDETANHLSRIAIGDLDRDGIPEIISQNRYTDKIFILDGRNGNIKFDKKVNFDPRWEVAIANLDDDDCAEIFFYGRKRVNGNNRFFIYAYDCRLNEIWNEQIPGDPVNYGLADFDGDGQVELYLKNEIRDAKTGTRIIAGKNWIVDKKHNVNGGPVAVDILGDDDLELVVGCIIYDVDLGNRTKDSGTLTELAKVDDYYIRHQNNATSVADYNQDGHLDVIASGSTIENEKNTTVFFWDVHNDVVKTYIDKDPDLKLKLSCEDPKKEAQYHYAEGWVNGTGRLNIADLDGDGQLNVSYVSGRYLYALDENFELKWRTVINEETSGFTGCTLFDFNGDGKSEVVYRDEQFVYIINGDGTVNTSEPCISRTSREYPIVADVDGDGSTELCVPCGYDDQFAQDNFCKTEKSQFSHIRVFRSNAEPWVPARRLWNQHGYFNVNVNDDLTIPRRQQKHHLVFSNGSCTTGANRPLNSFLNQSPFLNSDGCPTYASPDLAHVENSLMIEQPTCPDRTFEVSFEIQNVGDAELSGDLPISFYINDPTQPGAIKLDTVIVTLNTFRPGDTLAINDISITGTGGNFTLFIVLNDNGTTVPTPIILPNTEFLECDYGNNIVQGDVVPLPFQLTAAKLSDNIKCSPSSPDNGAAEAYVLNGTNKVTAPYNFFWYGGTTVSGAADYTGSVINNVPDSTYTVFATHRTAQCNSDTVDVVIDGVTETVSVSLELDQPRTDCASPNGQLRAVVNGGEDPSNFDFEWRKGDAVGLIISNSHIASNLDSIIYTVIVTNKSTGCASTESTQVPADFTFPAINANITNIVCSDDNSGSIAATADGGTSGFTFDWYDGFSEKPTPDFTGATYANLSEGPYTLFVSNDITSCSVDSTFEVTRTVEPVINSMTGTEQNSCDPINTPNGTATATIDGNPADHTFEWFNGQSTLPPVLATGSTATGLSAGLYTVEVTSNITGCSTTDTVRITENIVIPTLTADSTNVTVCMPPNGSVTAFVSVGDLADYTFSWYDGDQVKATPDYPDTDNVLDGIVPGFYTVEAFNPSRNCQADPITIEVLDQSPAINITQQKNDEDPPSDCNDNNGKLEISVDRPGNTAGFRLEWYAGIEPFSAGPIRVSDGVKVDSIVAVPAGTYTVVATDLGNQCMASEQFELIFQDLHTISLLGGDATQCDPVNGSLEITLDADGASPMPTAFTGQEGTFRIEIYRGTDLNQAPVRSFDGDNGVSVYNATNKPVELTSNFEPGQYTVIAVNTDPSQNGCTSIPRNVNIDQTAQDPQFAYGPADPNSNCPGATPNGLIDIAQIDGGAPFTNYAIEWFEGQDVDNDPALGTNFGITALNDSRADQLLAGVFSTRITNNATGCFTTGKQVVGNDVPVLTLGVTPTNIVDCQVGGAPNTGSAVALAFEDGVDQTVIYSFQLTDDQGTPPVAGTPNNFMGLSMGTYFITADNPANGCTNTYEFEIDDSTLEDPTINLVSFRNPTQCLKPLNFLGELEVEGLGNSPSGYSYQWFNASSVPIAGTAAITGQATGEYSVLVTNNFTNCVARDTFELVLDIAPIQLTASATPLTNCITPDGGIFAQVLSGSPLAYDYNWFNGSTATGTRFNTGENEVIGLDAGQYTVVAVDQVDPANCQSAPVTVTIDDARAFPQVVMEQVAPLTVCDLSRANGVARATVNGAVAGYTFEWFEGNTASGTPFYTGSEAAGLQAITYTVLVTDVINGCTTEMSITIESDITPIPDPEIAVLSHVTSCIEDNGALSVSIADNTSDYIFRWYNGSGVAGTPDFVGEIYDSLAAGFYTVTAEDIFTGCISNPVTEEIIIDQIFPEFEFEIGNASCGQNNGFISLIPTNDAKVENIEWFDENGSTVALGPNLLDFPSGVYTVTVTTDLGCETTREAEIIDEINPFNGVSRNGDSRNDFFAIDCITTYPENIVKIFNRAGTLVYEAEGYDNAEVLFTGTSNRGLSVMGNDLPDGTYFYVIDKRDGSKPLSGYLELVN